MGMGVEGEGEGARVKVSSALCYQEKATETSLRESMSDESEEEMGLKRERQTCTDRRSGQRMSDTGR